MILAVVWAPFIENFGSLFKYQQKVLSYAVLPIVALFPVEIFWKVTNASGAISGIIVGFVSGVIFFLTNEIFSFIQIHFLYVAFILFVFTVPVILVASLLTAAPPEEKTKGLTWSPKFYEAELKLLEGVPWYKNYRVLSVLLVLCTAALVIFWW